MYHEHGHNCGIITFQRNRNVPVMEIFSGSYLHESIEKRLQEKDIYIVNSEKYNF